MLIGPGDVSHASNSVDQRALELGRGSLAVSHQIKAVRDRVPVERPAVARSLGGAELAVVGVRGFVQIYMGVDPPAVGGHACHGQGRLRGWAGLFELAIRVERVGVPAVDGLVAPRADTWQHQQVDRSCMATELVLEPLQGALHTASFVAVDATGDHHYREVEVPGAAAYCKKRITAQSQTHIVQSTVLEQ